MFMIMFKSISENTEISIDQNIYMVSNVLLFKNMNKHLGENIYALKLNTDVGVERKKKVEKKIKENPLLSE